MPYNPGVVDRSGEIRAEGIKEAARIRSEGIDKAMENLDKNSALIRKEQEEDNTFRAKVAGLEQFIKNNPAALNLDHPGKLEEFLAVRQNERAKQRYERLSQATEFILIARNAAARNPAVNHSASLLQQPIQPNGIGNIEAGALEIIRNKAEQGDVSSQNLIGRLFYDRNSGSGDRVEAFQWFRKAAEQGSAVGEKNVGVMYYEGKGVEKNNAKALEWFRKAASKGNSKSQFNLGAMYYEGAGIKKDLKQAYAWWTVAAACGNGDASGQIALVRRQMSSAEIAEAEKIALFIRGTIHAVPAEIELKPNSARIATGSSVVAPVIPSQEMSAFGYSSLAPSVGSVIESRVDGDFEGWTGETIVRLASGQIYLQTEYYYTYHYAFNPRVIVFQSEFGLKMKVDGVDKAIGVRRLR